MQTLYKHVTIDCKTDMLALRVFPGQRDNQNCTKYKLKFNHEIECSSMLTYGQRLKAHGVALERTRSACGEESLT